MSVTSYRNEVTARNKRSFSNASRNERDAYLAPSLVVGVAPLDDSWDNDLVPQARSSPNSGPVGLHIIDNLYFQCIRVHCMLHFLPE
jgi:hypothetical protein